jgi:ribosomal protein S18 acetylase RimI-like enzyme
MEQKDAVGMVDQLEIIPIKTKILCSLPLGVPQSADQGEMFLWRRYQIGYSRFRLGIRMIRRTDQFPKALYATSRERYRALAAQGYETIGFRVKLEEYPNTTRIRQLEKQLEAFFVAKYLRDIKKGAKKTGNQPPLLPTHTFEFQPILQRDFQGFVDLQKKFYGKHAQALEVMGFLVSNSTIAKKMVDLHTGEIIGYIQIIRTNFFKDTTFPFLKTKFGQYLEKIVILWVLAIDTPYQRHSYGTRALEWAFQRLSTSTFKSMVVWANWDAIPFYQKHGFKVMQGQPELGVQPPESPAVWMARVMPHMQIRKAHRFWEKCAACGSWYRWNPSYGYTMPCKKCGKTYCGECNLTGMYTIIKARDKTIRTNVFDDMYDVEIWCDACTQCVFCGKFEKIFFRCAECGAIGCEACMTPLKVVYFCPTHAQITEIDAALEQRLTKNIRVKVLDNKAKKWESDERAEEAIKLYQEIIQLTQEEEWAGWRKHGEESIDRVIRKKKYWSKN